jgi:hypothetical protein
LCVKKPWWALKNCFWGVTVRWCGGGKEVGPEMLLRKVAEENIWNLRGMGRLPSLTTVLSGGLFTRTWLR